MDRAALEERLTGRARATADAAQRALQWFNDAANSGSVGQEQRALNREFRRFATAARKLEQAVARPMCVGVFGPSQAGKSYLVSVLARPGEKPLIADFDGEGKDFIAEINPEGGKESTGLVTRFSLTRQAHPKGFPVCLRLLSEADVIKIIANTFFLDGDLSEEAVPSPEDIDVALQAPRARPPAATCRGSARTRSTTSRNMSRSTFAAASRRAPCSRSGRRRRSSRPGSSRRVAALCWRSFGAATSRSRGSTGCWPRRWRGWATRPTRSRRWRR